MQDEKPNTNQKSFTFLYEDSCELSRCQSTLACSVYHGDILEKTEKGKWSNIVDHGSEQLGIITVFRTLCWSRRDYILQNLYFSNKVWSLEIEKKYWMRVFLKASGVSPIWSDSVHSNALMIVNLEDPSMKGSKSIKPIFLRRSRKKLGLLVGVGFPKVSLPGNNFLMSYLVVSKLPMPIPIHLSGSGTRAPEFSRKQFSNILLGDFAIAHSFLPPWAKHQSFQGNNFLLS